MLPPDRCVSTASAEIVRFEEFVSVCWAFNATPPGEGSSFGIRARPQKGRTMRIYFSTITFCQKLLTVNLALRTCSLHFALSSIIELTCH
jgi:hypothetical protein